MPAYFGELKLLEIEFKKRGTSIAEFADFLIQNNVSNFWFSSFHRQCRADGIRLGEGWFVHAINVLSRYFVQAVVFASAVFLVVGNAYAASAGIVGAFILATAGRGVLGYLDKGTSPSPVVALEHNFPKQLGTEERWLRLALRGSADNRNNHTPVIPAPVVAETPQAITLQGPLGDAVDDTIQRIAKEITLLGRRANLNLTIGLLITAVSGGFLGYLAFWTKLDALTTSAILAFYVPRIAFILFIEIFAYFFLRLYSRGLDDVKYYQNELTNVAMRKAAMRAAFAIADSQNDYSVAAKDVVGELVRTERNFVLKKGETTVELTKQLRDDRASRGAVELLEQLLKKARGQD